MVDNKSLIGNLLPIDFSVRVIEKCGFIRNRKLSLVDGVGFSFFQIIDEKVIIQYKDVIQVFIGKRESNFYFLFSFLIYDGILFCKMINRISKLNKILDVIIEIRCNDIIGNTVQDIGTIAIGHFITLSKACQFRKPVSDNNFIFLEIIKNGDAVKTRIAYKFTKMQIIYPEIIKGNERAPVIPYESVFSRNPNEAIFVFYNGLCTALWQSVVYVIPHRGVVLPGNI